MPKINFSKNINTYKQHRKVYKRINLRQVKLVSEVIRLIVYKNTKHININDIKNLAVRVYSNNDNKYIKRIYSMLNDEIVKKEIDNGLVQYYLDKGINPLDKIVELTVKAEENIKSTNDALSTARFYKEIYDGNTSRIKETRTYDSFDNFKSNTPAEIKQEVTGSISIIDGNSNRNDTPMEHKDGGMGEGERPE